LKTIELHRNNLDLSGYKRRTALESDCQQVINFDCILTENGKPIIYYAKIKQDTNDLLWAVKNIPYSKDERTAGLVSNSAVFGYMPRRTIMADYCHAAAMATHKQKQHYILTNFTNELETIYKTYFPDTYEMHKKIVAEKIKPEWKLENSVFTSGIVNKDNPLKYHHDAGNFKGVLSNMVCFKKGINGGRLALPEFGIKLEIEDNTLVIFNGQEILHGVTPIIKAHPQGYRYTIVYYSMEQMWKCDSINEELNRIRVKKTEREHKRLNLKPQIK
jgi:hypothetical protein